MICELCDICNMSNIDRELMLTGHLYEGYPNYTKEHHYLKDENVHIYSEYDNKHHLTHIQISTGFEAWWIYDVFGNLSRYHDNTGVDKDYFEGRLVSFMTTKGLVLKYNYDKDGKLISITSPTESIDVSHYSETELSYFQNKLQSLECCISPYCLKKEACCFYE